MQGEFQYQGQLGQYLEEWLSPIGSQPNRGFLSEEKQDSIQIEGSAPEGVIISNQYPEGEISTMVVVKYSDKVEGSGDNKNTPLCGGLYKEDENYLVPWSGKYTYTNMNGLTLSKEYNDWVFRGSVKWRVKKLARTYPQWSIPLVDPQGEEKYKGKILQVWSLSQS